MRVYFDASVLVALLTDDPLTARANAYLRKGRPVLLLSDYAAAELASAIAHRVRMGIHTIDTARDAYATFDAWAAEYTEPVETVTADVRAAAAYVRRLDLPLRAPDALHVAIAIRMAASIATFDLRLTASARAIGAAVAPA